MKKIMYLLVTILILLSLSIVLFNSFLGKNKLFSIRDSVSAGVSYPGDKVILENVIQEYFDKTNIEKIPNIKCLISPHAAYDYSGSVAAFGYKALEGSYSKVIILSPSHHLEFEGVFVDDVDYYTTPLGLIRVDPSADHLKKEEIFVSVPSMHKSEHAIELQLPFLQKVLGNFTLIPLVMGKVDSSRLATILLDYLDKNTLIIASSDLSHFYDYNSSIEKDKKCIDALSNLDFELIKECEACGIVPILTVMEIAKQKNWEGKLLDYKNSGDIKGENRVIGYMSFTFYEPVLNDTQKDYLLNLVRQTIEEYIKNNRVIEPGTEDEILLEQKSAFVTLRKGDTIKGCWGHVIPSEPLYLSVRNNALEIARNNPNFEPLKQDELDDLKIEISVLNPPHKIQFKNSDDLLHKIHAYEDGLVISERFNKATLLPKIWLDYGDKEEFLAKLCTKAGLSNNCWKEKISFYKYTAQTFEENHNF